MQPELVIISLFCLVTSQKKKIWMVKNWMLKFLVVNDLLSTCWLSMWIWHGFHWMVCELAFFVSVSYWTDWTLYVLYNRVAHINLRHHGCIISYVGTAVAIVKRNWSFLGEDAIFTDFLQIISSNQLSRCHTYVIVDFVRSYIIGPSVNVCITLSMHLFVLSF